MSELLPCPFCGGEAEAVHEINGMWTVECTECGALVDGIEAWNTRAERIEVYPDGESGITINGIVYVPERTCHNISDPPEGFYCSSCHWGDFAEPSHLLTASKYTGRESGGPNYCPNCGAKVVSE